MAVKATLGKYKVRYCLIRIWYSSSSMQIIVFNFRKGLIALGIQWVGYPEYNCFLIKMTGCGEYNIACPFS